MSTVGQDGCMLMPEVSGARIRGIEVRLDVWYEGGIGQ